MIEIYFDGRYVDSDNYANVTNDFKQFDNEFMIGTNPANTFKLEVPKACLKLLPEEYTEVEYIESRDGSAINSGYAPTSEKLKIETKFNITATNTYGTWVIGSSSYNDGKFGIQWWSKNFYVGLSRNVSVYSGFRSNTDYEVSIEANNGILTLNYNENDYSVDYTGSLYKDSNIGIFRCWQQDHWHAGYVSSQRIYYLKIYDNDILVRDFVPCYRNSDNEAGLYDLVNNVFYANDATGSFSCGRAINHPEEVTIKIDGEDYAHLIVDKYEYKDNDLVTFELTDKMTLFNFNYDASEIVPCTVKDILEDMCEKAGIELGTTTFVNESISVDFYNNTIQARQYLSYIAELMGGFARIGKDGKLYLENYADTNITIDIDDCEDFKIGEHHTIERVVFDNGLLKYETSSNEALETLYLNSDNVYINSETTFNNIANVILGFDFYSFKTGNCPINDNVMAGDVISFVNENDTYKTIAQYQINYNGQWLGGYELDINSKKQQETKQVGSSDLIKQLSVKLNRDENELSIMAQRVDDNSDAITELNLNDEAVEVLIDNIKNNIEENYTTTEDVEQLIINSQEGITNTLSRSGGTNLIRNSALLFEENDGYEYWTGNLLRGGADTYGVTSETGTVILTQSSSATQQIVLTPNDYTLTFKYKKLYPVSTITFKVNEETQDLSETEGEFEKVIHLDSSNITIDFLSSIDNGYIIYDLMLNKGDVASPYTQHANETTTDTVKIGKGISVESNSTDTTTKMDSDGFRVTSKGNQSDILLRATDTGTFTKTLEVLAWASIVNLYFQEVNGQTWITGL